MSETDTVPISKDEINVPIALGAFRDKVRDFGPLKKKRKNKQTKK